MVAVLLALIGLVLGVAAGRLLAARGVTAQNALIGRQRGAVAVVIVAGAIGVMLFFSDRLPWLPTTVSLYAEAAVMPLLQLLAAFALALLLALEWAGWRERRRRRQLVVSVLLLGVCGAIVARQSLPVTGRLGPVRVFDGVVMQSTPWTCAPASIATLARRVLGDSSATESRMTRLTRTTRAGTTTLGELRALRAAGLLPRFARGLTVDSLVTHGGMALLHVNEPVGARTIHHAVALLDVEPRTRTVVIGNPLYGVQVKRFDELEGYWMGEAVFVQRATPIGR